MDFAFKKLFDRDNKDLLIDFINSALPDRHVEDVEYIPAILQPMISTQKLSILDVLCKDQDGTKYIVEILSVAEKGFESRAIYYASKAYANQLYNSGKYADLKDVVFIAIVDFQIFPFERFISTHSICNRVDNECYMKDLLFTFIELPKFNKCIQTGQIDRWCELFTEATTHRLLPKVDPIIEKAYRSLELSNWSKEELLAFEANHKRLLDADAREDLFRDEGKAEASKVVVKNMLSLGLSFEEIAKCTGLTIEEVILLKEDNPQID